MSLFTEFMTNFFKLLDAMSVYIVFGLFFAGILKELMPDDFISKHLGKSSVSSVIKATLMGIPLPVCSCSVLPLAQSLKKEGASKGSIQSFLISSPITGVDSILATYSFFGWFFTIFRVVSSVVIAIVVGLVQNFIQKEDSGDFHESLSSSCCSSCGAEAVDTAKKAFSIKRAFRYAYMTLLEDMAKSLLIGIFLGAVFLTFVPQEYSRALFEHQVLTYFAILLFAIPLYTCATASLPIAAAFMLQGMSAGAAFIFLSAGPATSMVTISVVYKMLGKTSVGVYLFLMSLLSLMFGYMFDSFASGLDILSVSLHEDGVSGLFRAFSFLMLALISYHLFRPAFRS